MRDVKDGLKAKAERLSLDHLQRDPHHTVASEKDGFMSETMI